MAKDTRVPEAPYLDGKDLDAVVRMQTEMLSELWILKDRVLLLEHLLEQRGVVPSEAIDALQPDAALSSKLQAERDALVGRILAAGSRSELSLNELTSSDQE